MRGLLETVSHRLGIEVKRYMPGSSYKASLQALLAHHGIDLVLDVGANLGQYARMLRRGGYRGRIVSFEPLSTAHERLVKASAADSSWLIAPRMAIGERDDEVEINISANSVSSSLQGMLAAHHEAAPGARYVGTERVRLARLDSVAADYLADGARVFLKIDAQGYESQVLEGARELLPRVAGLQVELSFVPLYEGEPLFAEMMASLAGLGFELHGLFPAFTDVRTGRMMQADGIFFRSEGAQR